MDELWGVVWALAPTVLVGLVFWFVIRAVVTSDKKERAVAARIEAEERARLGLRQPGEESTDPVR